jgi:hypothetical protein
MGEAGDNGEKPLSADSGTTAPGKPKPKLQAKPIAEMRARLVELTRGWPCRVHSLGAKNPLLFVDCKGSPKVRFLASSEQFQAWLHEVCTLRFWNKQDAWGGNFVRVADMYHSFGGSDLVKEFMAVEERPHYPLIPRHYYRFRQPADYTPDGSRLRGFIELFSNYATPMDRVLITAAVCTPLWGGGEGRPYGVRPMFVIQAPDRGCGKTTLAEKIGAIAGGVMQVDLSDRGEDELMQRLLSPDALTKRVALIDNVKGLLTSSLIERMITAEQFNGKRMYMGDASRPNTLTWFVTANNARLSRDIALRSYFINLTKPEYNVEWDKRVQEYVLLHRDEIAADAVWVLRLGGTCAAADRWPWWNQGVLAPVCWWLQTWGQGVAAEFVLEETKKQRDGCDEELEEAEMAWEGIMKEVCTESGIIKEEESMSCTANGISGEHGYEIGRNGAMPIWLIVREPTEDIQVKSMHMAELFAKVMNKPRMPTRTVLNIIRGNRQAGRMVGIDDPRHTRTGSAYTVTLEAQRLYVKQLRERFSSA